MVVSLRLRWAWFPMLIAARFLYSPWCQKVICSKAAVRVHYNLIILLRMRGADGAPTIYRGAGSSPTIYLGASRAPRIFYRVLKIVRYGGFQCYLLFVSKNFNLKYYFSMLLLL